MVTMTKDGEFARLGRLVESDACQRWPMERCFDQAGTLSWTVSGLGVVVKRKAGKLRVWVGGLAQISPRKGESLDAFARRVIKRIQQGLED